MVENSNSLPLISIFYLIDWIFAAETIHARKLFNPVWHGIGKQEKCPQKLLIIGPPIFFSVLQTGLKPAQILDNDFGFKLCEWVISIICFE